MFRRTRPERPIVYCDQASRNARSVFATLDDVDMTTSARKADVLWLRKNYRYYFDHMKWYQAINHFPNEGRIIDKGKLTETLRDYDATGGSGSIPCAEFYQESWCLYEDDERERFFAEKLKRPDRENLWILKPGDLSKGRGIRIVWDPAQVHEVLGSPELFGGLNSDRDYIAQRYIRNPLLLEGRKSEIRVYWLVASVSPLMVLMYRDGTARLNTLPFRLDDFDNQLIHVTNSYQQKTHPDYDPDVELKWDWQRLESYVSQELGIGPADFLESTLRPTLKRYLACIAEASRPALSVVPETGDCFALFGADLILDDTLHPWLTEVQRGPGLSHDDPIKSKIIPPMLSEALRIVLEVQRRKREESTLTGLDAVERFEWVVNEAK